MKKILICIIGAIALTGCGDKTGVDHIKTSYFNQEERQIYNAYWDQRHASFRYTEFLVDVMNSRAKSQNVPSGFFCDSLDLLKVSDYRADKHNRRNNATTPAKPLSAMYEDVFGKTVYQRCGKGGELVTPTPVAATPVVIPMKDKGNVLSPEMYDKLIDAAKTCGRSRQHLISITSEKEYLTQEDYDEVMKSVMSCKKFELESQLQQQ